MTDTGDVLPGGNTGGVVADFSADRQAFQMPWGKAMMWISGT
jgi:cytochrome c oxidase subunit 3